MTEREENERPHDEPKRTEGAASREHSDLDSEDRRLEREMADFVKEENEATRAIEAELRKEHWGLEPPRRIAWKDEE